MELPLILVILEVALGLGAVIFIHELGHFLAAKWAGVKVERFSVGFPMPNGGLSMIWFIAVGWVLFGLYRAPSLNLIDTLVNGAIGAAVGTAAMLLGRWGSVKFYTDRDGTEYVLGFLPLGGYVKMLGQDDSDPSSMTNEQILHDPRSYPSQPVLKRMVIISAGVVMNVILAFVVFVLAFRIGVEYEPCVIRHVVPGSPAWLAGLEPGDEIVQINGRTRPKFNDLRIAAALSSQGEAMSLRVLRPDGEQFSAEVVPQREEGDLMPLIGIEPTQTTTFQKKDFVVDGFPAAVARSDQGEKFEGGDKIVAVKPTEIAGAEPVRVDSFVELQRALVRWAADRVTLTVQRSGADGSERSLNIHVDPTPGRTPGIHMKMGPIVSIQRGSMAENEGLKEGDVITHVDGRELGADIDPLHLPDLLYRRSLAGQGVRLTVKGRAEELVIEKLQQRPSWPYSPRSVGDPLAVAAMGFAYQVLAEVTAVNRDELTFAEASQRKGAIEVGDRLAQLQIYGPKEGAEAELVPLFRQPLEVEGRHRDCWAYVAGAALHQDPRAVLELTFAGKEPVRLKTTVDPDWHLPVRGIVLEPLHREFQTGNVVTALQSGARETWDRILQVYLMVRGIVTKRISPEVLGGPITIAAAAGQGAQRGFGELLMLLGIISANLAVINFFPIPVLDGGHMVFLAWELVRGKPPSEKVLIIGNYVGLAAIACLMIWVLYLDIVVHGRLG